MKALILLAHGSRDPQGAQPLAQIRAWVQAARPDCRVLDAYLSLSQPTLAACLESLHHEGVSEAVVLPLFVARGHHLNVELPILLRDLQDRFPALGLSLGPHLGADADLVPLLLARVEQARPVAATATAS